MICLETSFLIDMLKGRKEAFEKLREIKDKKTFTTSVCEYEVMLGAYLGNYSEKRLREAVSLLNAIPVYDFESNSALKASQICAELISKGEQIEDTDCMIAGIAISNGCNVVLTKNIEHFKRIKELKVIGY